jgi:hypothetical protein
LGRLDAKLVANWGVFYPKTAKSGTFLGGSKNPIFCHFFDFFDKKTIIFDFIKNEKFYFPKKIKKQKSS